MNRSMKNKIISTESLGTLTYFMETDFWAFESL